MNFWNSRNAIEIRKNLDTSGPERGRTRISMWFLIVRSRIVMLRGKVDSMSRTRSRTITTNITGLRNQTYVRTYDSGSPAPLKTVGIQKITKSIVEKSETMTDEIVARPEVYVDPKTLKWRRIRYPSSKYQFDISGAARLFGKYRTFRPVNPLSHVKTQIDMKDANREFVIVGGSHVNNWTNEYTWTYQNPYLSLSDLGFSNVNPASYFDSMPQNYSAGDYKKIDWYALTDSFQNSCESFTKAQFLAGEMMYESRLFVDAFKIILNPTSAVRVLTKHIRERSSPSTMKKYRRMTLGQFGKSCKGLTKQAVNAHLSYDFAVKPAIQDVKAALNAHSFVNGRMQYLRQHSGSFVPIRVRQQLDAESNNAPPGGLAPGVTSKLFNLLEHKRTTGVISAWGRVREDLDFEDTWSAYLQYFGMDRLLGLAWELIPFSFVIDWVTHAEESINKFSRLRTGGPFCGIRGLSASLKEETRKCLWLNPGYLSSAQVQIINPVNPVRLGYQNKVNYYRFLTIPQTSGLVDFSNLGSFHYTKLAELVFQFFVK